MPEEFYSDVSTEDIDQGAMADSVFNIPVIGEEPSEPPADAQKPAQEPEKPAGEGQPPAEGEPPVKPAEPALQRLGTEQAFFKKGEDGSETFDAENFLNFATSNVSQEPQLFEQAPPNQLQPPPAAAPEKPIWEQQAEEDRTYEDNMRNNIAMGPARMMEYIKAGYTAEQALMAVNQDIEHYTRNHMREYTYKKDLERKAASAEETNAEREMARLKDEASSNLRVIANELVKNSKTSITPEQAVEDLIYKTAAKDVKTLFYAMNGKDLKGKNQEDVKKMADKWFTKVQADKSILGWIAEIGKLRLLQKQMPEIIKLIRTDKTANIQNLREAQQPKSSGTGAPASKSPDDPENWLKETARDRKVSI